MLLFRDDSEDTKRLASELIAEGARAAAEVTRTPNPNPNPNPKPEPEPSPEA